MNSDRQIISQSELRKIQIEILDYVDAFCKYHDINYWLDSGTLLGAIRHKGYIPWDDDIDIGMLRKDYDRFISIFNINNNSKYKVYSAENKSDFYFPYAKVLDTETVLYEPDEKGIKISVNIDVFVYDNAPKDKKELCYLYDKRDRYRKYGSYIRSNEKINGILLKRIFGKLYRIFGRVFLKNYFEKKMISNSKAYIDKETDGIGNFMAVSRIWCPKSVFDSFIDVEFEGKLYKAPVGYDKWLKAFYGEYMILPPIEKRVSTHRFIAYK